MTNDKKAKEVEGFVAWHPQFYCGPLCLSKSGAIEELLRVNYAFSYPGTYCQAEAYFVARDMKILEAEKDGWRIRPVRLEFKDEDPWINVEERLPEVVIWVLGYRKIMGTYSIVFLNSTDGKFMFAYKPEYASDITHWMPLPPAPIA